jgi:uncharacterized delta-60 repeat protein
MSKPRLEILEDRILLTAGDLDPTFGIGGKVVTDFGAGSMNRVEALTLQPDGKILLAGETQATPCSRSLLALARYNSDGTLDPGFGTGGEVTTDFDPIPALAAGICVEPDGRIVVVGKYPVSPMGFPFASGLHVLLSAYQPNGTLDMTFGTGGKVSDFVSLANPFPEVTGVAYQTDGKILVGTGHNPTSIIRYNVDGSRDSGFGSGGIVDISAEAGQGIAVQPDGKILAGVEGAHLLRLNPDGSPDPSFGSGGLAFGAQGSHTILLQPDGRIVCLGAVEFQANSPTRFNVNGTLDRTFGLGGLVFPPLQLLSFGALQTDGKIVQATRLFELSRYNPDGSLDTSFGVNGKVTTSFDASSNASLAGVATQPDGRILAAGTVTGTTTNFGLVRYLGDAPIANANQRYVTQLYLDLLQRPVDASGLAHWTAFLDGQHSHIALVQAIEASAEYRALVIRYLYGYVLGRTAEETGLNNWETFLNAGGTAEQVEAYLLVSDEYFIYRMGANGTNMVFLQMLYRDVLHRVIDSSGRDTWGQAVMNGTSRSAVALAVLASLESDRMEVQSLYSRLLRRTADSGGLEAFAAALQNGAPNDQVIAAILGSDEYFSLVLRFP